MNRPGSSTFGDKKKFFWARDLSNVGQNLPLANETKKRSQGISVAIDHLHKYEVTITKRKPRTASFRLNIKLCTNLP